MEYAWHTKKGFFSTDKKSRMAGFRNVPSTKRTRGREKEYVQGSRAGKALTGGGTHSARKITKHVFLQMKAREARGEGPKGRRREDWENKQL